MHRPFAIAATRSRAMLGFRYLLSLDGKRVFGLDDLGKESLWRPAHIRWTHATTGAECTLGFAWLPGFQVAWTPAS